MMVTSPVTAGQRVGVDAVYMISIAGWNIARAKVDIAIDGGQYDASLFMQPSGVAKIITAVRTNVSATGRIGRNGASPARYKVFAEETDKPVRVDMAMSRGRVTSLDARPPLKKRAGRIPVTSRHKRGIVDPMSAGLLPIRRSDGRDACNRTLEIFDGWTRYDVRLGFARMETISTDGFSGNVPVCRARWVPVAGHRPDKAEVKYLERNRMLEMAVLPLPKAGIAIPLRVKIGTPNGTIIIQPTRIRLSGAGA